MSASKQPLILALVSNLYFTSRIQNVADNLGYRIEWVESGDQIEGGPEGFVNWMEEHKPSLVIVDLDLKEVPWTDWLSVVKKKPSFDTLQFIGFGSHKDTETLKSAKEAGLDAVLAKSRFFSDLTELIQKHIRES